MDNLDKKICFTIGHSNHTFRIFLELLRKWKIEYIIDIRSVPYSNYSKQFNREEFSKKIREYGFEYRYLGNMVGAGKLRFQNSPQINLNLKNFREQEGFQKGIKIIHTFIKKQKKIALMCSEKDPYTCHRFFLVSYCLQNLGVKIYHILSHGDLISNMGLETKLRKKSPQKTILEYKQSDCTIEDLYNQHGSSIYRKFSS
jgi:uncharacterized protein (DUF488 family)